MLNEKKSKTKILGDIHHKTNKKQTQTSLKRDRIQKAKLKQSMQNIQNEKRIEQIGR